jgi:NADP-dependent 3-hydroxy acid dehydrogenase YdfG
MSERMDGKVAVVTGASRGIGNATARALHAAGATVVVASRDVDTLDGLVLELGERAEAVDVDVTRAADVERLVAGAVERHGRIDLVVHAAGAGMLKQALEITDWDFDRLLELNLKGAFIVLQRAARAMAATGGGTIVTFPGVLGRAPMAMGAAYCASKYGLVGLVKAMAVDLKRANVRFGLLFLGGVDTSFWESPDIALKVQRDKMLSAESAARAVLFAASQAAPGIVAEIVIQPENHQVL